MDNATQNVKCERCKVECPPSLQIGWHWWVCLDCRMEYNDQILFFMRAFVNGEEYVLNPPIKKTPP